MKSFSSISAVWVLAVILGLAGASCATRATTDNRPPAPDPRSLTAKEPDATTKAKVQAAYGNLPLYFEANQGQTDPIDADYDLAPINATSAEECVKTAERTLAEIEQRVQRGSP